MYKANCAKTSRPGKLTANLVAGIVAVTFTLPVWAENKTKSEQELHQFKTRPDVDNTSPFLYAYHGMFFNHDRKRIDLNPAFINASQEYFIRQLGRHFKDKRYDTYMSLSKSTLSSGKISQLESVKVRAYILALWLNDFKRQNPKQKEADSSLAQDISALQHAIAEAFNVDLSSKFLYSDFNKIKAYTRYELSQFASLNLSQWMLDLANFNFELIPKEERYPDSTQYMNSCRAAGVPIPPPWGSTDWEYQGDLQNEFIDGRDIARVWAWRSDAPEGTCIALPRENSANGYAFAFGIICQGAQTENACFWDRSRTTPSQLTGHLPIDHFVGADELTFGGVCTNCHVGENAFVIHPDTPLDVARAGFNIEADWYTPLVQDDWPGNPPPANLQADTSWEGFNLFGENPTFPGSSCTSCHELPQTNSDALRSNYCNAVLQPASERTMPPESFDPNEHPAGWVGWFGNNGSDYRVHIEQLENWCNQ